MVFNWENPTGLTGTLTINRFNWTSWIQLVPVTSCFQLVPVTSWIQLVPVTSISKPSWLNGFNWKFSNRNFLLGNPQIKQDLKPYHNPNPNPNS